MMQRFLLFIFFFLTSTSSFSQSNSYYEYDTLGIFYATSVKYTFDDGFILTGGNRDSIGSNRNSIVIKVDSNGIVEWAKSYGNQNFDYSSSIEITPDSNYLLIGSQNFTSPSETLWLLKLNQLGDTIFERNIFIGDIFPVTSQQYFGGGYLICGMSDGLGFISKIDFNGDTLWMKKYGTSNTELNSVYPMSDSTIVAAGLSHGGANPDIYIVKTNSLGDTLFTNSIIGEHRTAFGILETTDHNILIVATFNDTVVTGGSIEIIKLDTSGNIIWCKRPPTGNGSAPSCVKLLPDSGFVILGSVFNAQNTNGKDPILVRTDKNGDVIWMREILMPNFGVSSAESLNLLNNGGFAFTGRGFDGTKDIAYIIRTDSVGNVLTLINSFELNPEIILFPNPANNYFKIKNLPSLNNENINFSLFNMFGQIVKSETLDIKNSDNFTVDLSSVNSGIYFARFSSYHQNLKTIKVNISK